MKRIIFCFLIVCLCSIGFADDKTKEPPKPKALTPTEQAKKLAQPKPSPVQDVILVVNTEDVNKVLVISVDGTWLADAREVVIKSSIGSASKPSIQCVMYKGLFRPTTPQVKSWRLHSIITASPTDFQKILDGLQNGKFVPNKEESKK